MALKYNMDGSLDISIQACSSGAAKGSNLAAWPADDPSNLTIHVYQPNKSLLDGSDKIALVTRAKSA